MNKTSHIMAEHYKSAILPGMWKKNLHSCIIRKPRAFEQKSRSMSVNRGLFIVLFFQSENENCSNALGFRTIGTVSQTQ